MKSIPLSSRRAACTRLCAAVLLGFLGSAALPATEPVRLTIGFAQAGTESAWRSAETQSIKTEASKRSIDLKYADAQGKQENQFKNMRSFIAQGVDAIVLAPVVEMGWEPVLREAKKSKIPVVLVDRGIRTTEEGLYSTLIASDFIAEGKMAAEWLVKKMNGTANIVELQGSTGAAPAVDRRKGFEEGIAASPKMKIIASVMADFRRSAGKDAMEALLKKHGNEINAVYAHNDDMALGAIQAIEESGKKPGVDIVVVSVDGVKAAFQAMAAGKLNCTVECNPLLGPLAFDAVAKAVKGEKLPGRIVVPDKVFEQSQARDLISTRQY